VQDLLAHVDDSWTELNESVRRIGLDGLTITGDDGWAVKEHLAHIGAWELLLPALLEGREGNDAMGSQWWMTRAPTRSTTQFGNCIDTRRHSRRWDISMTRMYWVAGNTWDQYTEHIAWISELAAKRI
jgi:hypothetical protein